MKKLAIAAVFISFFILSAAVFMPYQKIYESAINGLAKEGRVSVSYKISKSLPFGFNLNDIKVVMPDRMIKINTCKVRFYLLGFILKSELAKISINAGKKDAVLKISKNKKKYYIDGVFKTAILANFLDSRLASFVRGFKGQSRLMLDLTYKKNRIVINRLKVTGDFELNAKGYIQSGVLRLMGVVKIGKMKETFSI